MYWQTLVHLAAGRHPSFWYYERCLRHIASAWFGAEPENELIERIAHAVEEKTHAAHLA